MKSELMGDEENTRSGLFFQAVRIIREMREATHGEYPKYAIYENVPGAFSSAGGNDFGAVLEELARCVNAGVSIPFPKNGKWKHAGALYFDGGSIGWRLLDGQYWGKSITDDSGRVVYGGTPQRRKRIAVVLDLGNGGVQLQKYYLSAKACQGIINRALSRGKVLPDILLKALKQQVARERERERVTDTYSIQGSMIGRADKNGPQGDGVNFEESFTLNTIDHHAVAYGIGADIYNSAVSGDVAVSLTTATGQGASNTGPSVIQLGVINDQGGSSISVEMGGGITNLESREPSARTCYCENVVGCLCARDFKGLGMHGAEEGKWVIEHENILRRKSSE